MEIKKIVKKVWHFLWHEESLLSWIACLILLYFFIKFIFFPGLGLIFGAKLPVVIVESGSMEHNIDFEKWWEVKKNIYNEFGITKEKFKNFPMPNGFDKGDILIVFGYRKKNIEIGDVIIFDAKQKKPITHRIISLSPIQTLGDNNQKQLYFEKSIKKEQIIGRAVARIPKIGWIKLFFVELFKKSKNI